MMDPIIVKTIIGEDRHLELILPDDTPTGPVEVIIRPAKTTSDPYHNPAREVARAKLLAAGALVTTIKAPEDTVPLSPDELLQIGRLPEEARASDELINEDRGMY